MSGDDLAFKTEQVGQRLLPFVSMLVLLPDRNAGPKDVISNGTASFVDTGKRKLVITAGHVVDSFLEVRKTNPNAIIALSGGGDRAPLFDISAAEVLDHGKQSLDLAILALPNSGLIAHLGKSFFRSAEWPPVRSVVGAQAGGVGFPGLHREASFRGLEIRATVLCDSITSVSSRHFVLADEQLGRVAVKHSPALKDFGSYGGMSGCAVYILDDKGLPVQLAGFVYESGDGVSATIFVAHAAFIKSDGRLDWNALHAL